MPEDKDKPGIIDRIHKALGLKISPEQQAEIDRIKREGEDQNAALKRALDAQLEQTRQRVDAYAADVQARTEAFQKQLEYDRQHRPQDIGMVNDISFGPDGRINMQEMRLIHQWDDGFGNIIYTANSRSDIQRGNIVTPDQIHALSDRIKTQQSAFTALDPVQQSTLNGEFDSSKGTATSIQPYKDYLQNETLGKRFAELKANPPRPFGPK